MKKTNSTTFRVGQLFQPQYGLIWILFLMVIVFSFSSEVFYTPDNLMEILRASAIISILILGLTWIVATGEIDLSFHEVAAFTSMVTAFCIKNGIPWIPTIVITLVSGTLIGMFSGILVGYLRFPALITTIAVGSAARAAANIMGQGQPIYLTSNKLIYAFVYGKVLGVPMLFLTALGIYLICRYLQDRTIVGQHLYALGENRQATEEAGIKGKKIIFFFFIMGALLSSTGGILVTAQLSSGKPNLGGSFFMDGLTSVFLGAMIFKLGKPNVLGTLIGAIMLAVLTNGLTLLGLPFYIGSIVKGILLIVGVIVVVYSRTRNQVERPIQGG